MSGIGQRPAVTSAGEFAWLTTTVISLGLGIALSDGSPAHAQGAAPGAEVSTHLDEMVVTARRRAENIQQVPVAITAVSGDNLRVQGVRDFNDLSRVAPGFNSNQGVRGTYVPAYSIRGQRGSFTPTLLVDPAVAVYFAEMNLSRTTGTNHSMFDLQSLQILKGPQGTLFGRNSTGGAVLIEPNKPTGEFGGYLQGSVGNYNLRDYEAVINIPITPKVAVRMAGKITTRDGYLHSLAGQDLDDIDATGARVSVKLNPTDKIESIFLAQYFEGKGAGSGLKIFTVQPQVLSAATRPFVGALQLADLAATNAGPLYSTRTRVPQSVYDRSRSIQNNTTVELGSTFAGEITLKNVMGYKDIMDRYDGLGVNGSSVDVFRVSDSETSAEQESEEFQIQGKTDALDWVVGGFYFREHGIDKFTNTVAGWVTSPEFAAITSPAVVAAFQANAPVLTRGFAEAVNESYAGFFHTNYKLSWLVDGLSISGGVRQTHDRRWVDWRNVSSGGVIPKATAASPANTFLCVVSGTVLTSPNRSNCSRVAEVSSSVLTYDMGLDYRLNSDTLLYIVSRRGYRSGGFNNNPPNIGTLVGASFEPEFIRDVEIGEKADFAVGNVVGRLNTAVFYQWMNNLQRTTAGVNADGSVSGRTVNAATAHMLGGEVELTVKPTNAFEMTAAFSIIQPRYDTWFDRQQLGTVAAPNIVSIDVSDSQFNLVPYRQWSVSGTYTFQVPAQWGTPSLTVNWMGQSGVSSLDPDTHNCGPAGTYPNCFNNAGRFPGYNLVNMRADWRNIAASGVDFAAFVTNVTNEYYYSGGVNSIGSTLGYASAAIGAPRMFGVEMRVPFGSAGQ